MPTSDIKSRVDRAKADYKEAKKKSRKSFNKAYNYNSAHPIAALSGGKTKYGKKVNNKMTNLWTKAVNDADRTVNAKNAYKNAKQQHKERALLNDAGRKAIAKYMVNNNMSMKDAKKKVNKEAVRNSLLIIGGSVLYGAGASYLINKKFK